MHKYHILRIPKDRSGNGVIIEKATQFLINYSNFKMDWVQGDELGNQVYDIVLVSNYELSSSTIESYRFIAYGYYEGYLEASNYYKNLQLNNSEE